VANTAAYTTYNTRDEYPCPERKSNQRPKQSSGCKPMPKTAWPSEPVHSLPKYTG